MFLPQISELDASRGVILATVVKHKPVSITVKSSQLSEAIVALSELPSSLILLQRYQIIRLLLKSYPFAVQNQDLATIVFLKVKIVARGKFIHN